MGHCRIESKFKHTPIQEVHLRDQKWTTSRSKVSERILIPEIKQHYILVRIDERPARTSSYSCCASSRSPAYTSQQQKKFPQHSTCGDVAYMLKSNSSTISRCIHVISKVLTLTRPPSYILCEKIRKVIAGFFGWSRVYISISRWQLQYTEKYTCNKQMHYIGNTFSVWVGLFRSRSEVISLRCKHSS